MTPAQTLSSHSELPIKVFNNFYPFNTTASAITSNETHFFLFGGTNDSWFGQSVVRVIDKDQLTNLQVTDNPQDLYHVIGYLPHPTYNMGIIKQGSLVYLFGGVDQGIHVSTILKVNISKSQLSYQTVANLPFGMESPKVLRIGDIVYIFGGANGDLGVNQSYIYEFNLTDYTIKFTGVSMPILYPTVYYFNNLVYLLGGTSPDTNLLVNSIYTFNPVTQIIHRVGALPSAVDIHTSFQQNNKIVILAQVNNSFFSNQPMILDLSSMKVTSYSIPYLTGSRLVQQPQIINYGTKVFLFGGMVPYNYTSQFNLYQLDFSPVFGNTVISSVSPNLHIETVNNDSNFSFSSNITSYSFKDNHSQIKYPFNQINLKLKDTLSIKTTYYNHTDPDTRQRILIGFTSDTPIIKLNTFNTIPSTNFIGIKLQNVIRNNKTTIVISARVIKDKQSLLDKQFSYPGNTECAISFSLTILNDTNYYYSMNINGNIFGEIRNDSLTNMPLDYFATWNENMNTNYALEGNYNGSINSFSFTDAIPVQNNQYMKDTLLLGLFANFIIILVLAYISYSPRYKYIATGERPDGIPKALVSLGFYNLYLKLKKAFELINDYAVVNLEDKSDNFGSAFSGNFDFLKDADNIIFNQNSFKDISGGDIKILIVLLDYLDHGTYLKQVMVKSGIKKSTFYATINKLKELELIDYITSPNDQRKKFVAISPKGYSLLKLIYFHLDNYFNGKKAD